MSVRSRLDLSSALQRANRPTARSARKRGGCGTGRGLCRLPPVRARARRAVARGARASLTLAANTAGPSCYTAPGRLDDHTSSSSLTRRLLGGERSRVRRGRLRRAARVVVDAAPAHVGPPRDVARYASLSSSLSLSRTRERVPSIPLVFTPLYLFASPSQSPLLLRALVPRAERDLRGTLMILPQVHLRKPCYDFYFL